MISWRGGASPRAKCQMWAYVTVSSIMKKRKLEAGNHVSGYESPNAPSFFCVCFLHVYNVFNKKMGKQIWIYTLLAPMQCKQILFLTYNSTLYPLNLALTAVGLWFYCSLAIKSVPNLHGPSVQSEDSLKDSFSESSYFNNCSLGLLVEAPLSHALSCLLLKAWELRRLRIVTHLQIRRLLAEVPHLEGAGHGARVPDLSAGLTPAWAQLLASNPSWWTCATASSLWTEWNQNMKCKPKKKCIKM